MTIIYHNKDMDGYCSGAICRLKYPDAKLIGWDYKDDIPDFKQFENDNVIMIDITFPIDKLIELGNITKELIVIDHHISFNKDVTNIGLINFNYIYEPNIAACEIGWKYLFPGTKIPYGLILISRYDTWRQKEGDWLNETLPFKYYMYGQCNSVESFPKQILESEENSYIFKAIFTGRDIMKYQEMMDESATKTFSFETEAFGLKALCLNIPYFSSETLKSKDLNKYDILIGINYTGNKWVVSLRSIGDRANCSVIAKQRGGGGHKNAAGFIVERFENIFK